MIHTDAFSDYLEAQQGKPVENMLPNYTCVLIVPD
jgi:hypothetical protein